MTTLEGIEMSNGQPFAELVQKAAEQLLHDHPDWSDRQMHQYLCQATLMRSPTADELAKLQPLASAGQSAAEIEDVLWCIVMLPEFQIIQ
jgi:uncharacterized protein (DUF1697 family)